VEKVLNILIIILIIDWVIKSQFKKIIKKFLCDLNECGLCFKSKVLIDIKIIFIQQNLKNIQILVIFSVVINSLRLSLR
jgi:hypothetical protein